MYVCPTCGLAAGGPGFCTEDGGALADASADALLGQNVGVYRIAREIGRGAMGTVYLGVHPTIGSRVAVKVLSAAATENPALVERFFAEAKSVNVIHHESIVNVLDLARLPDGRPYIVMEHLEGAPLGAHLERTQPFPLGFLARSMIEVLGGLAAAHELGITHRDLKPDNVFITSLGRAKILDFGIAKLLPEHGAGHDATRTGALLGTPAYMSPEQAVGMPADARSDLYAVGVILFEGATGRRPFEADSLFHLLRQHVEQPPPAPRSLRPDLPPAFEAVILRALAKDPAHRYPSAAEFARELALAAHGLDDFVSLAPPTAPSPAAPRFSSTRPAGSGLPPTLAASAVGIGTAPGVVSAPGRRAGSVGLVLGGLAVLGVLVLLVGGGVLFLARGQLFGSQPPAGGAPSDPAGSADRGDVMGYLPTARELARKVYPDAEIHTISASGVARDGTVDTRVSGNAVAYMFRSPSAPKGSRACAVSVSVSGFGVFTTPYDDTSKPPCEQPVTPAPRCSLVRAIAKAPGDGVFISATYMHHSGLWRWTLITKDYSVHTLTEDDGGGPPGAALPDRRPFSRENPATLRGRPGSGKTAATTRVDPRGPPHQGPFFFSWSRSGAGRGSCLPRSSLPLEVAAP